MCVWVRAHIKMLTLVVVITRSSHQWESQFPFKRALCSSFPSFPSLPTSACLHLPPLQWVPSFWFISLFTVHPSAQCPKSIHFNAFMHALCVPYKRLYSLFCLECIESSARLATEKCRAIKGGDWNTKVKTRQKVWTTKWMRLESFFCPECSKMRAWFYASRQKGLPKCSNLMFLFIFLFKLWMKSALQLDGKLSYTLLSQLHAKQDSSMWCVSQNALNNVRMNAKRVLNLECVVCVYCITTFQCTKKMEAVLRAAN